MVFPIENNEGGAETLPKILEKIELIFFFINIYLLLNLNKYCKRR